MNPFSKTSIDRLGDRLRQGRVTDADLRLLDEYRRSFGEAYESVVVAIRAELRLEPTGRPGKSTSSIVEKLNRESIRLTQMQDIAGCRVVVPDSIEQETVVAALKAMFPRAVVVDRRDQPSHGYRAVHVIVHISGRGVEVQVRTNLQHAWAELSERRSDTVDPAIKYGGGPATIRTMLDDLSRRINDVETVQLLLAAVQARLAVLPESPGPTELMNDLVRSQAELAQAHVELQRELDRASEASTEGPT